MTAQRRGRRRAERSLGQHLVYAFFRYLSLCLLLVCFGYRRRGRGRVPRSGAYLLVANHQSYLDPPIVGNFLPWNRQFVPMARLGLFKSRLFGGLIAALNSIPVDQSRGDTGAMRAALEALDQGFPVCIFPEGARSPDGRIHPFKRGAALILKRSRCPVVPVAIDGAYEAWPRHRKWPRLFQRVEALVGEPIEHDDLVADGADPVQRIEREVRALHDELRRMRGLEPLPRGEEESDEPDAA